MITFVTCWYNFKAKFNKEIYYNWIDNMLSSVNNYNLVVYTDNNSYSLFQKYMKPNIKIIIKDYNLFHNYCYNKNWESNHQNNHLLNNAVDWKVNMLWSEKIHFVKDAYEEKYFDTEFYGWCDIGYFRNRHNDTSKENNAGVIRGMVVDEITGKPKAYASISILKNSIAFNNFKAPLDTH